MTKEQRSVSSNYNGFRHKCAIQLRFKDIDALGHVNNANHFSYLEIARVQYFNEVVSSNNDWQKEGFLLAKVTIDYLQPIYLKDEVSVFTRCSRVGNKSFDLEYAIVRRVDNEYQLLATAMSVNVCFDFKNQKSIPVKALWAENLKNYEGI
jgi:acyl-CoA thioester hydrolase